MNVKFELNDLKKLAYWITCKFKEDEFHHQASSAKRDLIGGFFDRWFNRAPEFLIFKELLKEKRYDIVVDNFLYGQDTKKNSPDVIGLQDENDEVIAVFTRFKDGEWVQEIDMPFIEVKTFRKTQHLITVPESQLEDEHYYVFVESNVRDDYLTSLFDDSFFSEDIFNSMNVSEEFIDSDSNNQIINPQLLVKDNELGYFRLIGIFKGHEIKDHAVKVGLKDDNPEKPRYCSSIEKIDRIPYVCNKDISNGMYFHLNSSEKNIPFYFELIEDSKATLIKELKLSIYVRIQGRVRINDRIVENGYYRIHFKTFDRSSKKTEYILLKDAFENVASNVTEELINKFDEIVT